MELLGRAAGVQMTHVPYRGVTAAVNEVVGGHVPIAFTALSAVGPLLADKRVRLLATSASTRVLQFPDTPTVAESGVPGFETGSWQGIVAPAGTPPEVVRKIHASVTAILATPEMKEKLIASGAEVRPQSPEQFGAFIRDEKARWAKVVKESGAKFD